MNKFRFLLGAIGFLAGFNLFALTPPAGCSYDKECILELPGSLCADGTPSFYSVIARKESENLLIFLSGGGACWDFNTCSKGYATHLSRALPDRDWNKGPGIQRQGDPANPFGNYTIVSVPYCTGDLFMGDAVNDYGTAEKPFIVRHHGYLNALLALQAAAEQFPRPDKVTLLGMSAGALGAFHHMENFDRSFPNSKKYVVSDAGAPFIPPHLDENKYNNLLKTWNVSSHFPHSPLGRPIQHFGDLLEHNRHSFPGIRYGLIQSYSDVVMTYFAHAVGSKKPLKAVRNTMIDVADHYLGPDAVDDKVFFVDSYRHTQTDKSLTSTKSVGTTLSQWLTAMVNDLPWQNQRPDLTVVAGRFWTPRAQAPLLTGLDDLLRLHGNLKDLHFAESTLQEDEADESSGFGP